MKAECSIVKDLLPLYVEDMVSRETAKHIEEHIKGCNKCRKELADLKEGAALSTVEKESLPRADAAKPFKKMMRRVNRLFYSLAYAALIFLIFLGFGWTAGNNLMYNSLIMPIVGIFGYYVFKWRAVYKVPALLLVIDLAIFAFQLVELGFADTLMWTMLYAIFVLIGVAIAFLLHYALKKEEHK
ncbi:MAG: zf-HC2 domain-containing protein [Clostridia bacterium]|nr:zf-HC2 domain-containing protein [Clostridia bacterium]